MQYFRGSLLVNKLAFKFLIQISEFIIYKGTQYFESKDLFFFESK